MRIKLRKGVVNLKKNINRKKIIIVIIILAVLIFCIIQIFIKKTIKNSKIGNNSSSQEIIENLMNLSSYTVKIEMLVYSNKNENKYEIVQSYEKNGDNEKSVQEILEPENISGVKIIQENDKLILENSRLSLKNIIENYKYITDNCIDLSSFFKEYKNNENKQQNENEDEVILSFIKTDANPYIKNRILTIDKKTGNPKKMECKSENEKTTLYILYNEVKLNTNK